MIAADKSQFVLSALPDAVSRWRDYRVQIFLADRSCKYSLSQLRSINKFAASQHDDRWPFVEIERQPPKECLSDVDWIIGNSFYTFIFINNNRLIISYRYLWNRFNQIDFEWWYFTKRFIIFIIIFFQENRWKYKQKFNFSLKFINMNL